MDFGFSEEQQLLRSEVRRFLDRQCAMETVRKIVDTGEPYSRKLWNDLAELGCVGLAIPEQYGGGDLDLLDLVIVLEETARTLFPSPLLSTNLAATAILQGGSEDLRQALLPGLADGSRVGTLALFDEGNRLAPEAITMRATAAGDGFVLDGSKRFVHDAGSADIFVVAFRTGEGGDDLRIAVIEAGDGVKAERHPTMDRTKSMGTVQFSGVRIAASQLLDASWGQVQGWLDRGAVMVCAESLGAAESVHASTVQYAKDRVQFDHPIGQYQAVKHPLAEMYVDTESWKSLTYFAAWAADHDPAALPLAASRAKSYASDAFARIGIDCIQLHGAIGYTAELDVQLFMKRAKWARPAFGDSDHHYERISALSGL